MNYITILGCGPSQGVPAPYQGFGACNPNNSKNYRLRCSSLLSINNTNILIDAGPDLRQQLLQNNNPTIDAVFFTHAHSDHVNGIDDLRNVCVHNNKPLPIYGHYDVIKDLEERFSYSMCNKYDAPSHIFKPLLVPNYVDYSFNINNLHFTMFAQDHGFSTSYGLRYGNMAYSTDIHAVPPESEQYLYGLDIWLIDCYQLTPHKTHSHLEQTLAWVDKFKVKKAILIHMNNNCDYDDMLLQCPAHVTPAYDGMVIEF